MSLSLLEKYRNYSMGNLLYDKANKLYREEEYKSMKGMITDKRIEQLEKDREFLLKKNIEFENNFARLEKVIYNVCSLRNNNTNNNGNTNNHSNSNNNKHKKLLPRSTSSISIIKQPHNNNQRRNSATTKMIKSHSLINITKHNNNNKQIPKRSQTKFTSLKEKEKITNTTLKQKINQLQNKIKVLEEELYYSTLAVKGYTYLNKELHSWQRKTEVIGKDMYDKLDELKHTLFNDKKIFSDEVLKTKKLCDASITAIQEKFQDTLNRQEFLIEMYTEQNQQIKKRLQKIRNIFY